MGITYSEKSRTFHLFNTSFSYIMSVLANGQVGNL